VTSRFGRLFCTRRPTSFHNQGAELVIDGCRVDGIELSVFPDFCCLPFSSRRVVLLAGDGRKFRLQFRIFQLAMNIQTCNLLGKLNSFRGLFILLPSVHVLFGWIVVYEGMESAEVDTYLFNNSSCTIKRIHSYTFWIFEKRFVDFLKLIAESGFCENFNANNFQCSLSAVNDIRNIHIHIFFACC
jgi:hypothetical protein